MRAAKTQLAETAFEILLNFRPFGIQDTEDNRIANASAWQN